MESHSLQKGDKILITGPTTGIVRTEVEELRVDNKAVGKVAKGDTFSSPISEIIRPSDKLYKVVAA